VVSRKLFDSIASLLIAVLVAGCSVISLDLNRGSVRSRRKPSRAKSGPKILLMDVSACSATRAPSRSSTSGTRPRGADARTRPEELKKAEEDKQVRALIVRINTPGRTVTASDIMYREVLSFKERTHRPVGRGS